MKIKRADFERIMDRHELVFSKTCHRVVDWEDYSKIVHNKKFKKKLIEQLEDVGIEIEEPDYLEQARDKFQEWSCHINESVNKKFTEWYREEEEFIIKTKLLYEKAIEQLKNPSTHDA